MTHIADRYAVLKHQAEALQKQIDAIEAEIKTVKDQILIDYVDQSEIHGAHCTLEIKRDIKRTTLDSKLARQFLTLDEQKICDKVTFYDRVTVKAKVPAKGAV
jgi:hypothetical protein